MQAIYRPRNETREETFLVKEEYKPMEQELRVMSEAKKKELLEKLKKLAYEYRIER
jgi:hypothetical protein